MNVKKIIAAVLRTLLALVFIFSGLTKAIDPWGTAIKLGDYFGAFGMEWLSGGKFIFSIMLSGFELALGIALLLAVRQKIVSFVTMLFMAFFTVLTLIIAVWNPVQDCGCFGDVLKISNWQTFYKNLVLFPMSIALWRLSKKQKCDLRSNLFLVIIFLLSCSVGVYALRHLPIIDTLPYKVGTDLLAIRTLDTTGEDVHTKLIYKDKLDGSEHTFELTDTAWYDTTRWEYVDTHIDYKSDPKNRDARDFAIFDGDNDITDSLLTRQTAYMICVTDINDINENCMTKMTAAIEEVVGKGCFVICVTPSSLPDDKNIHFGKYLVTCYNVDATTLKTMIRAKNGVIKLEYGVVENKLNCRDVKINNL